jgi:hypothetical protein
MMTPWIPGATAPPSLLSAAEPTPEQQAELDRENQQADKYRTMLFDIHLESYRDGYIDLEDLGRLAKKITDEFPHEMTRHIWLGALFDRALGIKDRPARTRGGQPISKQMISLAVELVGMVSEREGLPIVRPGDYAQTVFHRVEQILADAKYPDADASKIAGWYFNPKRKSR